MEGGPGDLRLTSRRAAACSRRRCRSLRWLRWRWWWLEPIFSRLAILGDSRETARYELAVRAVEGVGFLPLALATPTLFILNRRLSTRDVDGAQRAFDVLFKAVLVLGVGLSAVLTPLASEITQFAYGSTYRNADGPLAVMSAVLWVSFLVAIQGGLLSSSQEPWKVVPFGAAMVVINLAAVCSLLPGFGAMGAAWATVLTQCVAAVLYAWVGLRLTQVRTRRPPWRIVLAGSLCAATAWRSADLGLTLAAALSMTVYVAGLVATRAIGRDDLRLIRGSLGR